MVSFLNKENESSAANMIINTQSDVFFIEEQHKRWM